MADILFHAHYLASTDTTGKTGLTPTIDIHRVTRSSGASSEIVTAGNMTETGDGLYHYLLSSADLTLYDYSAVAKTADTSVTQKHVACLWTLYSMSWHDVLSAGLTVVGSIGKRLVDYVDAAISGRAAPGAQMDLVNAPNATGVSVFSAGNWNYLLSGGNTADAALSAVGSAADPLANQVPGTYLNGSAGYALGKIGNGKINTVYPITAKGKVTTVQGCDYLAEDGLALDWTDNENLWPTLTAATITVIINDVAEFTGSVVTATGTNKKVRLELTAAQTRTITPSEDLEYRVIGTLSNGHKVPLVESEEGLKWVSKKEYDLV